ncbi:unnamed protein product [Dimorphilus gyrociliatus]|uniref:Uncharacterized protein n=1 Tax=Dimorphilus gyrociliatus TaxID=2664684 RepID=A0A7I8VM98_9ANNE|nr:unnamed protein product [Dimorphilus gyrociliatus]
MQTPFSTPPARTIISTPDAPRIDRVRASERVYMESHESDLPMYESVRQPVTNEDQAKREVKGKSKRKGSELKNPWILMKKCRKLFSSDKTRTQKDSFGAREKMDDCRDGERPESNTRLPMNEANKMWLGNLPF